jgi:hypothetical protein
MFPALLNNYLFRTPELLQVANKSGAASTIPGSFQLKHVNIIKLPMLNLIQ